MARLWVYDRTSGDDTGAKAQDPAAQAAQTKARTEALGHVVAGVSRDDNVSGSTNPNGRPGFMRAVRAVQQGQADGLAVREYSRVDRRHPGEAVLFWEQMRGYGIPVLCLGAPYWTTLDAEPDEDEAQTLLRLIDAWRSWSERAAAARRTRHTMDRIKAGAQQTKTGRPMGRPKKPIPAAELDLARSWLAAGMTMSAAARALSKHRGAFDTDDGRKRRDRTVSRPHLAAALAAEKNPSREKSPGAQEGDLPASIRPVSDSLPGGGLL